MNIVFYQSKIGMPVNIWMYIPNLEKKNFENEIIMRYGQFDAKLQTFFHSNFQFIILMNIDFYQSKIGMSVNIWMYFPNLEKKKFENEIQMRYGQFGPKLLTFFHAKSPFDMTLNIHLYGSKYDF